MGFIEELRRQKEAERQTAEKAKQLVEARAKQEQELKLAAERQKKLSGERRRQEIEKATEYFNKSDFPRLTHELASVVGGMKRINKIVVGSSVWEINRREDIAHTISFIYNHAYYPSTFLTDVVGISLIWYEGRRLEHKIESGYKAWHDIHKLIAISCDYKGTITVAKSIGDIRLPLEKWSKNPGIQERALEKAYNNPKKFFTYNTNKPSIPSDRPGPCLPGNSFISTPNGLELIKDLRVGDFVWTVDRFGRRVKTVIARKAKRIASRNHKVAHIILKDGRELIVSPGHPTIDYKEIGDLVKGDNLGMSTVASIKVIPYKGKYTYDILPYGDTGGYWANNILIGSTLSDQFKKTISDGLYKPLYLSL